MKRNKHIVFGEMEAIVRAAEAEGRAMSAAEEQRYDALAEELDGLGLTEAMAGHRERREALSASGRPVGTPVALRAIPRSSGASSASLFDRERPVVLRNNERISDWARRDGQGESASLGRFLRGIVTGDWRGADEERAMSEGTATAGGHLVPVPLASQVLDLARNQARVFQAGALTVPMESATLKIAKVTGDPTAAWHAESATITPSDITLGAVTFTAQTLVALVKFSRELFEDAQNLDAVVRNTLSAAFAVELDRVALYGTGTAPQPRGVKNFVGLTTQSMGANGLALPNYDKYVDAALDVMNANLTPTGIIQAPRTEASLAKLKDTTNQPLMPPALVAGLPRYATKQVPVNLTQGTANNASDAFIADWSQLMIGMRTEIGIDILKERYSDTGEYAALAWMRADVQAASIAAFSAIIGIIP